MPTRIYNAGPTSGLVTTFDVKGKYSPQLDEVVVPVAIVADVRDKGPIVVPTYWGTVISAATASERPIIEFRPNAGIILEPLLITVGNTVSQTIDIHRDGSGVTPLFTNDLGIVGTSDKIPHAGAPVDIHCGSQTGLGVGNFVYSYRINQSTTFPFDIDLSGWELGPGDALNITGNALNTAITWSVQFRFRAI